MGFRLRFCSCCCEFVRMGQWIPLVWAETILFPLQSALQWDLIGGGCSSTWSRAPCTHCPFHQRLFGSPGGIGNFTIPMRISGHLLNQAICSVKELLPSQSKKGLNVEHRESTTPRKITKRNKIIPSHVPLPTWWTQVSLNLWLPQNTTQSLN